MSDQFWLTKAQLKRIEPFFPRTRGIPRDDRVCQRDSPCNPEWSAMAGCARGLWPLENMFARLKDWRRISMRYDRCAHTFFSAI